jgi:hypothetical protein
MLFMEKDKINMEKSKEETKLCYYATIYALKLKDCCYS